MLYSWGAMAFSVASISNANNPPVIHITCLAKRATDKLPSTLLFPITFARFAVQLGVNSCGVIRPEISFWSNTPAYYLVGVDQFSMRFYSKGISKFYQLRVFPVCQSSCSASLGYYTVTDIFSQESRLEYAPACLTLRGEQGLTAAKMRPLRQVRGHFHLDFTRFFCSGIRKVFIGSGIYNAAGRIH